MAITCDVTSSGVNFYPLKLEAAGYGRGSNRCLPMAELRLTVWSLSDVGATAAWAMICLIF